MAKEQRKVRAQTEEMKRHGAEALEHMERLKRQSSERLTQLELNQKWFDGDEHVMWARDRPKWKPKTMANLLEANCRTKVALLTNNKPKMYVYGIPDLDIMEALQRLQGVEQTGMTAPETEEMARAEGFRRLTKNMNIALDHFWRFNDMHTVLEQIVLNGSISRTLCARVYWDERAAEIRCEPVHPRNVFFDKHCTGVQIEDGSTDVFIVRMIKPIAWFEKYWPDHAGEVKPIKEGKNTDTEDEEASDLAEPRATFIEAFFYDDTVEETQEGDNPPKRKLKYPNGRRVVLGGDYVLEDGPIEFFPYIVHPYEYEPNDFYGRGDVERQIPLVKDFNSKLAQISLNIALSANRQYIINPAKLGMKIDILLEHFSEPGYVFQTKNMAEDVKSALQTIDTPHFNPELFQYLYFIPKLLEQVSGIVKAMQGMPEKSERQTKYEIGKQYEAATIRIRNTAHHVERFLVKLAQTYIKALKIYYTGNPSKFYSLNEQEGTVESTVFQYPQGSDGSPLDYDFIITVQPDTMLPIDLQSQAERDMQLVQMGALDPITLLETLNHPRVQQVQQRLQQMAAMNQQTGAPAGNSGPPGP